MSGASDSQSTYPVAACDWTLARTKTCDVSVVTNLDFGAPALQCGRRTTVDPLNSLPAVTNAAVAVGGGRSSNSRSPSPTRRSTWPPIVELNGSYAKGFGRRARVKPVTSPRVTAFLRREVTLPIQRGRSNSQRDCPAADVQRSTAFTARRNGRRPDALPRNRLNRSGQWPAPRTGVPSSQRCSVRWRA